jgi:hypothetical protein
VQSSPGVGPSAGAPYCTACLLLTYDVAIAHYEERVRRAISVCAGRGSRRWRERGRRSGFAAARRVSAGDGAPRSAASPFGLLPIPDETPRAVRRREESTFSLLFSSSFLQSLLRNQRIREAHDRRREPAFGPCARARRGAGPKKAKAAYRAVSLEALAAGWTVEQIAEMRKVSPRTIRAR